MRVEVESRHACPGEQLRAGGPRRSDGRGGGRYFPGVGGVQHRRSARCRGAGVEGTGAGGHQERRAGVPEPADNGEPGPGRCSQRRRHLRSADRGGDHGRVGTGGTARRAGDLPGGTLAGRRGAACQWGVADGGGVPGRGLQRGLRAADRRPRGRGCSRCDGAAGGFAAAVGGPLQRADRDRVARRGSGQGPGGWDTGGHARYPRPGACETGAGDRRRRRSQRADERSAGHRQDAAGAGAGVDPAADDL